MTQPTQIIGEVEHAFEVFNQRLFQGRLVQPIVRVSLKKRPHASIRFYANGSSYDLVIGCGISEGTMEDFLQEILHEMVHVSNYLSQITDCTANQYHNYQFRDIALSVGLFVQRHKTRGWGVTAFHPFPDQIDQETPKPAIVRARERALEHVHFDRQVFEETQRMFSEVIGATDRKQFQYKYICQCPPPYNSVRCGRRPDGLRPLEAKCLKCETRYVLSKE